MVDDYLRFVKARVRPNSLLAVAFDLKVFFEVVGREPVEITMRDVLAFVEAQCQPRRGSNVVRIDDGEQGLSARTVKRRLSSVSGLFASLAARGDVDSNPVPRGLSTRRVGRRGVPLIRAPHTLPRGHCCIEAKGVPAVVQSSETGATSPGDNYDKSGI